MNFTIEIDREDDGRWIAEIVTLPGVLASGAPREAALAAVSALALRVVAERLDAGETSPEKLHVSFDATT